MTVSPSEDINLLSSRRSELHRKGFIAEAIHFQIKILQHLKANGGLTRDIANAHNYLSVLYAKNADYRLAETHAQRAIDLRGDGTSTRDSATSATYSMVMARILCALDRREEAILHAESALRDWALTFPPANDFFEARRDELAAMKAGTWKNLFVEPGQ